MKNKTEMIGGSQRPKTAVRHSIKEVKSCECGEHDSDFCSDGDEPIQVGWQVGGM